MPAACPATRPQHLTPGPKAPPPPPPAPTRFDHPDAPETDLAEAARQLRTATAHDYARQLATPPPKRKGLRGLFGGGGKGEGKDGGEGEGEEEEGQGGGGVFKLPPLP